MPNSIDFYKGILLHIISVRIIVPRKYELIIVPLKYELIQVILCQNNSVILNLSAICPTEYNDNDNRSFNCFLI